ncbi:hypothetical protein MJO28_014354 [Puccinia striiformis f. sp. tritici]|uniref:Uncharacterized protein n=1 Tax=Puccinia striiformis f. sp. tritici TaxID=168172 RepID=A0ACC0DVD2_9BASI|nr:hypothetical protein MJO28_014354 [Puccinia striiformis f. sp. tritici]
MAVCDEAATTIQATALTKARWEAWQRLHLFELFGVTGRDGCITQGCHLKGYSRTESTGRNCSCSPHVNDSPDPGTAQTELTIPHTFTIKELYKSQQFLILESPP